MKSKGFTLIELLVVVAIISLISSIMLASLTEAKNRANQSKFKQEMSELIKAIELYKADNRFYPGGDDTINKMFTKTIDGVELGFDLASLLSPYLTKLPKSIDPPTNSNSTSWNYRINNNLRPSGGREGGPKRCVGDTFMPEYVITIQPGPNLLTYDSIENWKTDGVESLKTGDIWTKHSTGKCFSF